MAHAAFAGWCKPVPGTPDPFERASFTLLSSRSGDASPKDAAGVPGTPRTPKEPRTPMIWPQTGSCTRRLQLEKAAAVAAAALPQQLPAGASVFWPGLNGSDDCKSDYAESDAYASDGDDPPPPPPPPPPPLRVPDPPPRRSLPQAAEAKAEVEASGKVEAEDETESTLSRGTRRQRSPPEVDLPQPRPSPAELRTPSLRAGIAPVAGTRNLSALARARSKSFHKTAISPRVSKAEAEKAKAEAEKRPSNYFFGESWLHQLDCADTIDGEVSPHARGFANHHADGYTSC